MKQAHLYGIPYIPEHDEQELLGKGSLGRIKSADVYEMVTKRIVDEIEKNNELRWEKGWSENKSAKVYEGLLPFPINYHTNKYYRGINALLLSYRVIKKDQGKIRLEPITDERLFWLTFKQLKQAGGKLKKGAAANTSIYYNFIYKYKGEPISEEEYKKLYVKFNCGERKEKSDNCNDLEKIPFLKYYNVFNEADIEGIDFDEKRKKIQERHKTFSEKRAKIEAAEMVVNNMPQRPVIKERNLHSGENPHYAPARDEVVVPLREQYNDLGVFYGTLFHELSHSTGAKSRLARPGIVNFEGIGSESYAFEELVAELGAAFLNAESGILLSTLKKNTAYIKSWKKSVAQMLREDNKAIFKAAGQAQKAADFILDRDNDGMPAFYKELEKNIGNTDKEKRIRIAKVKAKAKLKLLKLSDVGKIETANPQISIKVPVKYTQGSLFGVGEFGTIYTQFKGQPVKAIRFLRKKQEGEAVKALYREDIGYIDIVWGEHNPKNNKGFGLKHIIEKHGEEIKKLGFNIENFIPAIVQHGDFNRKKSDKNKAVFESSTFRFVVSLNYKGEKKTWLLTAFDILKKPKI